MNCANHPDSPATAFCRECGKPMCQECQRPALGSVYCAEHLPAAAMPPAPPPIPETPRASYTPPASPYTAPLPRVADPSVHPVLALILGFLVVAGLAVPLCRQ
jgi:hypothetical protein